MNLRCTMAANYPIGPDVNSVFFADFNGDGLPDLAVAYDGDDSPGGIAILLNKGDGTFENPVIYASGTQATNFAVLDLNHDGVLDIAMVSLDQKVTVLLGKGRRHLRLARQYARTNREAAPGRRSLLRTSTETAFPTSWWVHHSVSC